MVFNPKQIEVSLPEALAPGITGIVFDAVGTLIEPVPGVADVYCQAAARQGIALDRAVVKQRFHHQFRNDEVDEARGPLATDETNEWRRWRRIVASVLPEVPDPDRAFDELWTHFGKPEAWACFDDVPGTLRTLDALGLALCVASNFDGRLEAVANGLNALARVSSALVISSRVGHRKPHPRFYAAVADRLGGSPARVLWVGDDIENDVLGPRRAGFRSLLIDRGSRMPEFSPRVSSLEGLGGLIGGGGPA